jgi:glucokinase
VEVGAKQVRLAWIGDGARPASSLSYAVADFPTLTDVLLRFERDSGRPLANVRCAMSVSGSTAGEVVSIARGRWTVSRSGLASIFRRPVLLLNLVSATAWSLLGPSPPRLQQIGGAGAFGLGSPGRWLVANIDQGVGLAGIDIGIDGRARIIDCEMGHCGFPPENAVEDALLHALRKRKQPVSWEHALTLAPDDALWAGPGLPAGRGQRLDLLAGLAGAFVGDAMLALGAWNGAFVIGTGSAALASPSSASVFNSRFEQQPSFGRVIKQAPRWRMETQDSVLTGLAVALAHAEHDR